MKLQEVKRMFDFGGFTITGVLFSSVFPRRFKILDDVILPVPKDCPDAARIAEVTIGNKLTTATLRILADTAEILITLEDRDIEYYKETYIFTPAPNMLELPID